MKQPFYKKMITGAAWCSVALLWLCAISIYINPVYCRFAGVVGLGFPFFLAGVLLMLVVTLLFAPRQAWIPVLGMAACFFTIRAYCPVNFPSSPPKGALKVLSYNTEGFGGNKKDSNGRNMVAAYIAGSGADIVCLQEAYVDAKAFSDEIVPLLRPTLPYFDTVKIGTNVLACFSRFPIVDKQSICSNGGTNGSAAFRLELAPGDTLHVVNCHLESMHLSPSDRQKYHALVRDPEKSDVDSSSRMLVSKISTAAVTRAQQATLTAKYVEEREGQSILLCGDFNDTPVSFTHHRIESAGLKDAYVATGNGIGRSFNRDAIYVRIDNIMCSPDWKPYDSHVDRSSTVSDHYPIYAFIKRK